MEKNATISIKRNGEEHFFTEQEIDHTYKVALAAYSHAASCWQKIPRTRLLFEDVKATLTLRPNSYWKSATDSASAAMQGLLTGTADAKLSALKAFEDFASHLERLGVRDRAKTWPLTKIPATAKDIEILRALGNEKLAEAFEVQLPPQPKSPGAPNEMAENHSAPHL